MRIKLTLQYIGTHYSGWQVQPNGVTIQEILQKALSQILQEKITVVGSGRTDAGVHALAQVAHFDTIKDLSLFKICRGLNAILPKDISVLGAESVPRDFHAQLSAKSKTYAYQIWNHAIRNSFLQEYSWHMPYPLDIGRMQKAARYLVGEHDFKSFCAANSTAKTTVRRIKKIQIVPGPLIHFSITGSGFLKHMVRNIVGTLVEVGQKKRTPSDIKKILKSHDRRKAGRTAPAKGLFLVKVIYS